MDQSSKRGFETHEMYTYIYIYIYIYTHIYIYIYIERERERERAREREIGRERKATDEVIVPGQNMALQYIRQGLES